MHIDRATPSYEAALFRPIEEGGLWMRRDVAPFVPKSTAVGKHLEAWVNDGRWIVQCPCGSAQLVDPRHARFFCVECLNDYAGRQWVTVDFPEEVAAIEHVLEQRHDSAAMNWTPGESVDDLRAENAEHGIEG